MRAREGARLASSAGMNPRTMNLAWANDAMRKLEDEMRCASQTDASVMLTGESGVGKRFAANMIHQLSHRRRAPFVAINAARCDTADSTRRRRHDSRGRRRVSSGRRGRHAAHSGHREDPGDQRSRSCWDSWIERQPTKRHVRLMTATDRAPVQARPGRRVPRRPVLPVERDPLHHSAASGTARGHSVDVPALLVIARGDRGAPAVERCAPAARWNTPGQAIFAN